MGNLGRLPLAFKVLAALELQAGEPRRAVRIDAADRNHRHARVNRLMTDAGYRNVHDGGTRRWRVVLYGRNSVAI